MSSTTSPEAHNVPNRNNQYVIALNTQNSIKLTGSNFPAWKIQPNALLIGYDIVGFVDGTNTCPAPNHQDYNYWCRQDQLILHAIISSVDQNVITLLSNVKSSKQAWDTLNKMFASKTRARIMYLKERLSRSTKRSKTMSRYLHDIKSLADELAVINCPLDDDDDIVIHILNGLGTDYREITAAIRERENPIGFDELHDLLTDFEAYQLRYEPPHDSSPVITAHVAHKNKSHYQKQRGSVLGHTNSSSNHNSPQHSKKPPPVLPKSSTPTLLLSSHGITSLEIHPIVSLNI
ncbi:gag-polypeptide of LTR copia-type [Sesbania bispinosa]|nr:gag-polypeptide of LTR copia-type [Sesbania bispinosa]